MSAYSYWESNSKDLFDDLQINFSVETMRSFLQSIWLGDSLSVFYAGGLPKAIYMHGNPDEVYTRKEREFIEKVSDVIIFSGDCFTPIFRFKSSKHPIFTHFRAI